MTNIQDKLKDPSATFTVQELYQVLEAVGDRYGFYRDPRLPQKDTIQETSTLMVDGFEHLGPVIIRPRTFRDSMITIPSLQDKELGDNMNPGQQTRYNALLIAIARCAIVSPPGFVDELLKSTDTKDFRFFEAFAEEYGKWMDGRIEEAHEKKSGKETAVGGSESVSLLETDSESSLPILAGSISP